jgi:metallo-beta-lactamase family protein
VSGEKNIKIFGSHYNVKARIETMDFLSAHADHLELLHWLLNIPTAYKHCLVTHVEEAASDKFRITINEELNWSACVPIMSDKVIL